MPVNLSQRFTGATQIPNSNIFSGTAAAFIPPQSVLSMYATFDATTPATDVATISLTATQGGTSQQPIASGYNIGQAEGAGEGPILPDDVILFNWGVPAMSSLLAPIAATQNTDVIRVKTYISP